MLHWSTHSVAELTADGAPELSGPPHELHTLAAFDGVRSTLESLPTRGVDCEEATAGPEELRPGRFGVLNEERTDSTSVGASSTDIRLR